MQKEYYENPEIPSSHVVGHYGWHENYPYETFLLYRYGDIRLPIFPETKDKMALDFGCGPGRMVSRMNKVFHRTDGCDISQRLLDEAKKSNPDSNFYLTNGDDLGEAPKSSYDFVFCTISLHHIPCYEIRKKIISRMHECLKESGSITLQMCYNKDFPFVGSELVSEEDDKKVIAKRKMANIANYFSNDYHASATNCHHDVGIGEKDLPSIKADMEDLGYRDVEFWFSPARPYFSGLRGHAHTNFWFDDWIYIHAKK